MLAVLRKMMAKDPADRYQEPIEVAEALAEWADMPVTPPPPREMPVHCPLVQALAGPTAPISGRTAGPRSVRPGSRGVLAPGIERGSSAAPPRSRSSERELAEHRRLRYRGHRLESELPDRQ